MEAGRYISGIYVVDFEFRPKGGRAGNPPDPVCLVVKRLDTGTVTRLWRDNLKSLRQAPFPTGPDALWVAFFSSAEWGCFLSLGWKLPEAVLDLYAEFRQITNGVALPCGNSLLGALAYFQLPSESEAHKEEMRGLILRGGPWSDLEQQKILDYCESDVVATESLYRSMAHLIDVKLAVLRGRYMVATARIEHTGIPLDTEILEEMRAAWPQLKARLIKEVDRAYGVYENDQFKTEWFAAWLIKNGMAWPVLPSGALKLDEDTFRAMALTYPSLSALRQLRSTLSKTKEIKLEVGDDGRSRCLLSPFRAKTGRNQPSTTKFPYGLPSWMRFLIKPEQGMGLAYIDWEQQEFGIGAALSGDRKMQDAYVSGDPYLEFAKQAGAVPSRATKKTHATERDQFKACVLATQYGLGEVSLAERIGVPVARARQLLSLHKCTYPIFWKWSDAAVDEAILGGRLWTCFGWQLNTCTESNDRSLRNFPMQAHGAEMLRLACILMTEAGIGVCAPVHDALLIEAPDDVLEEVVTKARSLMAQASRLVLSGFELRTDATLVKYPERLTSDKGGPMWETVRRLIAENETTSGQEVRQ